MASSPTDSPTATAFALQEITACWDQGYEALAQGDLERVAALLDLADEHLAKLPPASDDDKAEAILRTAAIAARGRLEHGMRSGLAGLKEEIGRSRRGGRALNGYRDTRSGIGSQVTRDA